MDILPRIVTIPVTGSVSIETILPIIDSPEFQILGDRYQLGPSDRSFRGATHTRYVHSLGAYALMETLGARWVRQRLITQDEAKQLSLFALLHDVGHGPFSHSSENACTTTHKDRGLIVLKRLRHAIERCGGDYEFVRALFAGEHPLAVAVTHHPLGVDKLDYLRRDAAMTGVMGAPVIDPILHAISYANGQLVCDNLIIDEVMQLQRYYFSMYDRVYFRKVSQIFDHFLLKMINELIRPRQGAPEITEEELWELADFELRYLIKHACNPVVRLYHTRWQERRLPKVAISLRPGKYAHEERTENKDVVVCSAPASLFATEQLGWLGLRRRMEEEIAVIAQVPAESVLICPVIGAHRFSPKPILIQCGDGRIRTLRDMRPQHHEALEEMAQSFLAVRICVFAEHRKRVAASANAIARHIIESCAL